QRGVDADGDGFIDLSKFIKLNTKGVDSDEKPHDVKWCKSSSSMVKINCDAGLSIWTLSTRDWSLLLELGLDLAIVKALSICFAHEVGKTKLPTVVAVVVECTKLFIRQSAPDGNKVLKLTETIGGDPGGVRRGVLVWDAKRRPGDTRGLEVAINQLKSFASSSKELHPVNRITEAKLSYPKINPIPKFELSRVGSDLFVFGYGEFIGGLGKRSVERLNLGLKVGDDVILIGEFGA
ncbi:hypothetical protein G4B88_010932, partial [Cannabis sativa]